MLIWFRVQASRVAVALLVFTSALGASHVLPHQDDCHDAACAIGFTAHDASAHRVRGGEQDGDSHPLHCLVCHWARAFRPHLEARVVTAPAVQAVVRIHVEFFTAASASRAAQPPLRSPPASPFL